MEAWSPYASNYNNPIRNSDLLGDEPEDGPGPKLTSDDYKYISNASSTLITDASRTMWTSVFSGVVGAVDAFVSDNLLGVGNIDVEKTGLIGANAIGYQVGQKVGHGAATLWGGAEEAGAGLSLALSGGTLTPLSLAVSAHGVNNIARGLSGITEPIKTVHGNNKGSNKVQHGYGLWDRQEKKWDKFGISGQKLNKNGSSPRANKQAYIKNNEAKWDRYVPKVLKSIIRNRIKALWWEYGNVNAFQLSPKNPNGESPRGNVFPNPNKYKKH